MSNITTNSNREKIWDALILAGLTPQGAAGVMGNLQAESVGCLPSRVEALLIQRYKEQGFHSWPYGLYDQKTSELYTKEIDNGTITKEEFLSPRQYTGKKHQYGYGLAQWTTKERKEKLWSFTRDKGKSIADIQGQIDFLVYQLKNISSSIWSIVSTTDSINEASDIILTKFEAPANANKLKATRRQYSKEYYNLYKNRKVIQSKKEEKMAKQRKITVDEVLERAAAYVGYEEKKSNNNLEDFHANRGSNNYQKFQPLANAGNGNEWCQFFIDGIFVEQTGSRKNAQLMLCMDTKESSMTGYTPQGKAYFVQAKRWYTTPQRGDIIYFYSSNKGRVGHTGIVERVDTSKKMVYTIEGNTRVDTYAENGGCVARHSYSYASIGGTNRVNGFGRPRYNDLIVTTQAKPMPSNQGKSSSNSNSTILSKGSKGQSVKTLQTMLNTCGYNCGEIDGDFGTKTDTALRAFQKANKLEVDGQYGPKSKEALEKIYKQKIAAADSKIPESNSKKLQINTTGIYSQIPKAVGKITTYLNIRKGPDAKYPNLTSYPTLKQGTEVEICDMIENKETHKIWYFIKITGEKGSKFGFANASYINII